MVTNQPRSKAGLFFNKLYYTWQDLNKRLVKEKKKTRS
jgi:hypothetical protein